MKNEYRILNIEARIPGVGFGFRNSDFEIQISDFDSDFRFCNSDFRFRRPNIE